MQDRHLFDDIELHSDEIYVMRSDLTDQVDQHKHSQAHILVVLDGVASLDVEKSQFIIPNGYFVWIPQGIMHRVSFNGRKVSLLNIYFPNTIRRDKIFEQIGDYPIPSILYHIIEMLKERSIIVPPEDWRYELLATTVHILPHVLSGSFLTLRLPTSQNYMVQRIIDKIQKDYYKPLTLQHVSKELGLSERSINRYMSKELGMSFTQYLRIYRITIAIRKMANSDDSLTNIAYEVGYDSLTAFSNTFYKITGLRPSQFFSQEHLHILPKDDDN